MSYVIRAATPHDVADLHHLILALAEYEQLRHLVVAQAADLERALFGPRSHIEALVVTPATGGAAVAFALYFHNFSTFLGRSGLYLEDLFVTPGHRRQGIARALMQRLAALALERGCGRFEWSVLDWNRQAITFYEGLGAKVLPDWRVVRVTGDELVRLGEALPGEGISASI